MFKRCAGWITIVSSMVSLAVVAAAPQFSPADLETHWLALRSEDPDKVAKARIALASTPEQAIPFLTERLIVRQQVPFMAQLVAHLANDKEQEWRPAFNEIEKLGVLAEKSLRQALDGKLDDKARQRIKQLLERLPREGASEFQAVWVLEAIGTEAARKAPQKVAEGHQRQHR